MGFLIKETLNKSIQDFSSARKATQQSLEIMFLTISTVYFHVNVPAIVCIHSVHGDKFDFSDAHKIKYLWVMILAARDCHGWRKCNRIVWTNTGRIRLKMSGTDFPAILAHVQQEPLT